MVFFFFFFGQHFVKEGILEYTKKYPGLYTAGKPVFLLVVVVVGTVMPKQTNL